MGSVERGQVSANAATVYEEFFLPALFEQWAPRLVAAAQLQPGQHVVDVACGTGVVARAAAERVAPGGTVVGVDVNEGMLAEARRRAPRIEWRRARAEALPFGAERFDAVLSQFGLMFFDDQRTALREMWRVLRPGGRLAVAVWDTLEKTPGYAAMVRLLDRLFGADVGAALRAPYAMGDRQALTRLLVGAGIAGAEVATHEGTARFASIEAWVRTDIKGWTLADRIDDSGLALLLREARQALRVFQASDGSVSFRAPAHIATAVKA